MPMLHVYQFKLHLNHCSAPKSPMTFSMTPSSPKTPTTPGTPGSSNAMFTFTDPSMNARAATVKEILLTWCQMKTKEYEVLP